MPRISVIIPTFNRARICRDAVQSVLAQTSPPHEIIVVDDGSEDTTREMIAQFGDRVHYIHQDNEGASAARNRGCKAATGEWIALLDSDDLWAPEKLEKQIALLAVCPTAAVCYCNYEYTDMKGCVVDRSNFIAPEAGEGVFAALLAGCPVHPCSVVVRKACLRAGPFDVSLRYGEDWDLLADLADKYQFAACPEVLLYVRKHSDGLTSHFEDRWAEDSLRVVERVFSLPSAQRYRRRKPSVIANYAAAAGYGCLCQQRWHDARRWLWRALKARPFHLRAWRCMFRTVVRKHRQANES